MKKFNLMQGMMLWDFYNYLPNDILVKVGSYEAGTNAQLDEAMAKKEILENFGL